MLRILAHGLHLLTAALEYPASPKANPAKAGGAKLPVYRHEGL